jgi:hypothetical protein
VSVDTQNLLWQLAAVLVAAVATVLAVRTERVGGSALVEIFSEDTCPSSHRIALRLRV